MKKTLIAMMFLVIGLAGYSQTLTDLRPTAVRCNDSIMRGGGGVSSTLAYSSKDAIADSTVTNVAIVNAARMKGGSGWVTSLECFTNNTAWVGAAITICIYDTIVPKILDQAQFTKLYANKRHKVGEYTGTFSAGGTGSDCVGFYATNLNFLFKTQANSRNLYILVYVTTVVGTPTRGQKFYFSWMIDQY